mgnify:CR=1 FL=1
MSLEIPRGQPAGAKSVFVVGENIPEILNGPPTLSYTTASSAYTCKSLHTKEKKYSLLKVHKIF